MYIRRFYYDLKSGERILSYMRQGDVLKGNAEEDFLACPELLGRSTGDTGLFEWTELIPETESQFSTASRAHAHGRGADSGSHRRIHTGID